MNQATRNQVNDRNLVRRAFDDAADSYDASAVLEAEVLTRHLERLEFVNLEPSTHSRCRMRQWPGDRHKLRDRFPGTTVLAADFSLSMLGKVSDKPAQRLCADLCALPLQNDSVDLIFSNLTLQWVVDLDRVFSEFRRVLRPQGLLSFTSYGPDTLIELRSAWATVDGDPHVNQFIDMHDVGDALVRSGFAEPVMDIEPFTLSYKEVGDLMADLKQTGAHNLADPDGHARSDGQKQNGVHGGCLRAISAATADSRPAMKSFMVTPGRRLVKTSRQENAFHFPASAIGRRGQD